MTGMRQETVSGARLCLLLRLVVAGSLALAAGTALAHGVTMKLRHPLPADSAFHRLFVIPWTEKIHQDAGGRISIQVRAGDAAPEKLLDAVIEGDADIVWTDLATTGGRVPALEPFELPFITHDASSASRAMIEYVRLSDATQASLDGARVLAAHQVGAPSFHMRKGPMTKASDLTGAKIGSVTPAGRLFLTRAGATAVEVPLARVGAAMAQDELDGMLLSWDLLPAGAAAPFHAEPGTARLDAPVFLLLMHDATYRGLADDLKKVIQDNSGSEVAAAMIRAFDAHGQAARQAAADRGERLVTMPAEEVARLQPAAQAMLEDWLEKGGRKQALDAAREALAQ